MAPDRANPEFLEFPILGNENGSETNEKRTPQLERGGGPFHWAAAPDFIRINN